MGLLNGAGRIAGKVGKGLLKHKMGLAATGAIGTASVLGASKNVTNYDKSTAVKSNGSKFNMGRLIRSTGKDGRYVYKTADGTVVSDSSGKLTNNAWNYLASKYGKDYANRTSANMISGNIWLNGRWRPDYKGSGNKTVDWKTATKGQDMNMFNKAYGTAGRKGLAYNGTTGKVDDEAYNGKWDDNSGVAGNALKWMAGKMGYKLSDTASTVGELGAYFIPGVGTALAAGDAVDSLRKGEYGLAALNAAFAIPGLGAVGKLIKGGMKLSKVGRAAAQASKAAATAKGGLNRVNKIISSATKAGNTARLLKATNLLQKFASRINAAKTALNALTSSRGYRAGEMLLKLPLNKLIKWGTSAAGAGLLLSQAPTLLKAGKAYAKDKYYGDDYDKYTFDLRKLDAMDIASTDLEKQDISNQFDDALTNALYSSNDYGYGYDA